MIRVWLATEKVHCVLKVGFWEERGLNEADCWGILLADLILHIANAHEAEFGCDPRETIHSVRATFEREIENATSRRLGEFVANPKGDSRGQAKRPRRK